MAGRDSYFIRSPDGAVTPLHAMSKGDLDVIPRNNCHVRVISVSDLQDYADIYHPGCVPGDVKPVVVGAADLIPARPLPRHETQYVHIPPENPNKAMALVDVVKSFE
ncbi:hypothetical protein D3C84_1000510 [compost metagenome]